MPLSVSESRRPKVRSALQGALDRMLLYLKVYTFRLLAIIGSFLDRYASIPLPPRHSFTRTISTSSRKFPGQIKLYFYTPPGYGKDPKQTAKYQVVVNFHGGGYTLGHATHDGRWAAYVTKSINAVVVSVEYGLAPEHPFPIGIGDGVDAIRHLWSHADEYSIDKTRTVTSGFSAGGTIAIAAVLRLHEVLKDNLDGSNHGKIVGITSFYGGVDWTQSRAERTASNAISATKGFIPPFLYDMFDNSYLGFEGRRPDMRSPWLSPGRADGELLKAALPTEMTLYSCEYDQLLVEEEAFRERLKGLGFNVGGRMVKGVPHAWDKAPTFRKGDAKRNKMYEDATERMKDMLR